MNEPDYAAERATIVKILTDWVGRAPDVDGGFTRYIDLYWKAEQIGVRVAQNPEHVKPWASIQLRNPADLYRSASAVSGLKALSLCLVAIADGAQQRADAWAEIAERARAIPPTT